jgi:hypothetical protein
MAAYAACAETTTTVIDKERCGFCVSRRTDLEIGLQRLCGSLAKEHLALAAAFALHPQGAAAEVNILGIQGHQLTDADTRGIEQLQESLIP